MSKPLVQIGRATVGAGPAVVGVLSTAAALAVADSLAEESCDIVELRVDLIGERESWRECACRLRNAGIPVLLTLRIAREGGTWVDAATTRERIMATALPDVAAVDIEVESTDAPPIVEAAKRAGRAVIASFHDFAATPDEGTLRSVIARGRALGADVVKIACLASVATEIARLRRLIDLNEGGPVCVLPMGPDAAKHRIDFARAGSCLVYGFLDTPNAPGQPSARDLRAALSH